MQVFERLPAIPGDYPRLSALTDRELDLMRRSAYLGSSDGAIRSLPRAGIELGPSHPCLQAPNDTCGRIFIVWFCFLYERFMTLEAPLAALEELVLEFGAPSMLDTPDCALGQDYAGAAGAEPVSDEERARHRRWLAPPYAKAVDLLHRSQDASTRNAM